MDFILNLMVSDMYKNWDSFSCATYDNELQSNGSLEGVHNTYHGAIGGTGGHMSRVPIAAFDPIFFMSVYTVGS